jgi:cbb3-type cytochrome oxidase maturation protein
MSALYLLIIASIVVAGCFLGAFIWSVRSNQYEDQKGSALRILFDSNEEYLNLNSKSKK